MPRYDFLDGPPQEDRLNNWLLALAGAALFAFFCWASNSDYIDEMRAECAARGLDYDATSDRCVAPANNH